MQVKNCVELCTGWSSKQAVLIISSVRQRNEYDVIIEKRINAAPNIITDKIWDSCTYEHEENGGLALKPELRNDFRDLYQRGCSPELFINKVIEISEQSLSINPKINDVKNYATEKAINYFDETLLKSRKHTAPICTSIGTKI